MGPVADGKLARRGFIHRHGTTLVEAHETGSRQAGTGATGGQGVHECARSRIPISRQITVVSNSRGIE